MFIFAIAVLFIFSLNFAFAIDDNSTDLQYELDNNDELLEVDEISQIGSGEDADEIANDELMEGGDADEISQIETEDSDEIISSDESENILANESVKPPTIDNGKVIKRYNVGIEYSATFYDESGNPLANTIVWCGLNSPSYGVNATTNSKGVASFLFPLEKGSYKLYLWNPKTSYWLTDQIKVFDVIKGGKNVTTYFNSGKTYTVRVYGNDGKPIKANEKVVFKLNNKKQYVVKTDKKGYAKLKIKFQPGAYYVIAKYKNFMAINKIIVKPVLIQLTKFGSKPLKSTFKFKVKLLTSKGKAFKNKRVKTKFNKKLYKAKTNKRGIATFTFKTPKKAGKYPIVSMYGKAKASSRLTIFK